MFQALVLIIFFIFGLLSAGKVFGQTLETTQQKTREIVAALAKTKYKHKVKRNFEFEHYIDIKNEPVVKAVNEYAGVYEASDADYRIELRFRNDGKLDGNGYETDFINSVRTSFTLRDAKINGALLSATKVYQDGHTDKLEAVFINGTVSEGLNPNKIESRETKFGLGFVHNIGETSQSRVFCEYQP